eukprot:4142884-Prymnesium_polylepis.1
MKRSIPYLGREIERIDPHGHGLLSASGDMPCINEVPPCFFTRRSQVRVTSQASLKSAAARCLGKRRP